MENKEKIKMLILLINEQGKKVKKEEEKLSDLREILRREIEKNIENLDKKNEEELIEIKEILNEILETLKYDSFIFPVKREVKRLIWKIIGEQVYREQRCEQKQISREEFESFWKEFTSPSLGTSSFYDYYPSVDFLSMYEKIFEKEFPF